MRVVVTRAVHQWAELEPERQAWLAGCLRRHVSADWGDLDTDDWTANDAAARQGCGRVLSAYRLPAALAATTSNRTVWVITDDLEDPAAVTTILWPSGYYATGPTTRGPYPPAGALSCPPQAALHGFGTAHSISASQGANFPHRKLPQRVHSASVWW
jgi:hypothetical protein